MSAQPYFTPSLMSPRFTVYTTEMAAAYTNYICALQDSNDEQFKKDVEADIQTMFDVEDFVPEFEFLKNAEQKDIQAYMQIKQAYFEKYPPIRECMNGAWFLSLYKDALVEYKDQAEPAETALLSLLEANIENPNIKDFDFTQEDAGLVFQKQFRTGDIVEAGGVDWAIWNLLSNAPIFIRTLKAGRVPSIWDEQF